MELKKYAVQLTVISKCSWISEAEITLAITLDLNARGLLLEQLLISKVEEAA